MDDSVEAQAIVVLTRIGSLKSHRFQQVIKGSCDHRPQNRPNEKYPDFVDVVVIDNCYTQGSSWVHGSSGVVDAFMICVSFQSPVSNQCM